MPRGAKGRGRAETFRGFPWRLVGLAALAWAAVFAYTLFRTSELNTTALIFPFIGIVTAGIALANDDERAKPTLPESRGEWVTVALLGPLFGIPAYILGMIVDAAVNDEAGAQILAGAVQLVAVAAYFARKPVPVDYFPGEPPVG